MDLVGKLRIYLNVLRMQRKVIRTAESEEMKKDFYSAELIRYTHSIEKGLSIENPRLGFGHEKQELLMSLLEEMEASKNEYHIEAKQMALDAIGQYLVYHEKKHYTDETILKLKKFVSTYSVVTEGTRGGVVDIYKDDLQFDIAGIEKFFNTRHSIRDFETSKVDEDSLRKALTLAQRAPSACNRQGVRAYVLSEEYSKEYAKGLSGIGGFEESVARFILITGKISAYRIDEINQFIVSASMYASYLTLTLHLYGLGGCVIQRDLICYNDWEKTRDQFKIEKDEQLVCLLAVGNLKSHITVPESHRLSPDIIFKFVD